MVELELLNKELTKRLETFEEMGKASDIKLNIMEIKNQNSLRGNKIEIYSIPACENEEVKKAAEKIALKFLKEIDTQVEKNQVRQIRRVRFTHAKTEKHKETVRSMYSPTLVEFKSIDMKIKIMKEKKMLFNHKLSEIIANNIFINENLTKTSRTLLSRARKFRKENNWKHAWTKNGSVMVRLVVNSFEDIEKLLKKSNNNNIC